MIQNTPAPVHPSYLKFTTAVGVFTASLLFFVYMEWDCINFTKFQTFITIPFNTSEQPDHVVQHKVCVVYNGRMGNNMFQYASAFGIARSKGMQLYIPAKFPLLKVFKLTAEIHGENDTVCDPKRVITRSERQACAFDKNLVNFNNTQDVRVALFLQSYLYFDEYSKELRKEFLFKDEIRKQADKLLENILKRHNINKNNVTLVGVHVRRGDYVNHPVGYKEASREYLHTAVKWYLSKYKNIHFIVASNGLDWTKKNMPPGVSVSYLNGNEPWVDMATISSTNHFISTVGTFSWWSGWLTGGNVTYYKWPSKEKSVLRKVYSKDYSDFFYPNWIGF